MLYKFISGPYGTIIWFLVVGYSIYMGTMHFKRTPVRIVVGSLLLIVCLFFLGVIIVHLT